LSHDGRRRARATASAGVRVTDSPKREAATRWRDRPTVPLYALLRSLRSRSVPLCTLSFVPPLYALVRSPSVRSRSVPLYALVRPPSVRSRSFPLCTLSFGPPLYALVRSPSVRSRSVPLCTLSITVSRVTVSPTARSLLSLQRRIHYCLSNGALVTVSESNGALLRSPSLPRRVPATEYALGLSSRDSEFKSAGGWRSKRGAFKCKK
jgi:hypothetical protein